jgi:hypothetical protein
MSYEFSALTLVSSIRNSLQGVSGFSVVKELIQNANDSGAQGWAIGWTNGLPDAHHPLLRDPALFVVNDGRFSPTDAKALRQLHLSGKADDRGSIGKFGLGLKSIFQLAEAFFFFADQDSREPFEEKYPGVNLISPWIEPSNAGWSDARSDWQWEEGAKQHDSALVYDRLPTLTAVRGFTLWVPLRTKQQCVSPDGRKAEIQSSWFGGNRPYPKDIFNEHLPERLAHLWPLLSSLKQIHILGPTSELCFELSLDDDSVIRQYPKGNGGSLPLSPNGICGITRNGSMSWTFAGLESAVPSLLRLREHDYWPKSYQVGLQRNVEVKDKSIPHAAAVFQKSDSLSERGELRFWWSVFLPIGRKEFECIPVDGSRTFFDLTLHGFFFLSPARTEIVEWDDAPSCAQDLHDESDVQRHWNSQLARLGTLRNVLPALDMFAKQLTQDDVRALTAALQRSTVYRKYQVDLCADFQWVHRLQPDGSIRWALESSKEEALIVPDLSYSRLLFPNLHRIAANRIILDEEDPSLTIRAPVRGWPTDLAQELLDDVFVAHLGTARGLRLLTRFLEYQTTDALTSVVLVVIRALLRQAPKEFLSAYREEIHRLLEFVPPTHRLALPQRTNSAVVERLLDAAVDLVVIPPGLGVDGEPQIATGDALRLLNCLVETPDVEAILSKVLTRCVNLERVLELAGDKLLFELKPVEGTEAPVFVSRATVQAQRDIGTLFARRPPRSALPSAALTQKTFEVELQKALPSTDIFLFDGAIADLIGVPLRMCDRQTCLELLRKMPDLSSIREARLTLFKGLWLQYQSAADTLALRYLLHGDPSHFSEAGTLFFPSHAHPEWSCIVRWVLSGGDASWRWLADFADLDVQFQGIVLKTLDIAAPHKERSTALLKEQTATIDFSDLMPEEHDFLLREIADPDLARNLPIHLSIDGRRVRIDEGTYLESDFQANWNGSGDLFDSITFIRKHPTLGHAQTALGLLQLGHQAVVQQALRKPDPSNYWRDIMVVLPHLSKTSFGRQLQTAVWVPTRQGKAVAPQYVLRIAGAEEVVAQALRHAEGEYLGDMDLAKEVLEHPQFPNLIAKVLPERNDAIRELGRVLGDAPSYHIGQLSALDAPIGADLWVSALGNNCNLSPAIELLARLGEEGAPVWDELTKAIPLNRTFEFLISLRNRHQRESSRHVKEEILKVHDAYLGLAVTDPGWKLDDERIRLLSKAGTWCVPAELCYGQEGVDRQQLLVESQARRIGSERTVREVLNESGDFRLDKQTSVDSPLPRTPAEWAEVEKRLQATVRTLENYFSAWRGYTKDELIGGFIALLGDDPRVRELARRYLGNWDLGAVRSKLNTTRSDDLTFQEILEQYRFIVRLEPSTTFRVENLLGDPLIVTAMSSPDTLFAGRIDHERYEGVYYVGIRLLSLDPESGAPHMRRMLRDSAATVLMRSLGFRSESLDQLDRLWEELEDTGQLDLAVTRSLILDSSFQYIKGQLGVKSAKLARLFKTWDDARYALGANAQLDNPDAREVERAKEAIKRVQQDLCEMLQGDPEVQDEVLAAVNKKLLDYQYALDSIPFELFQNADDALVELDDLDQEPSSREFTILSEGAVLDFLHWGRPINSGGRAREFHRDLEKMLTINASGKDGNVTGKFGLGFKSIFLIAERPQVLSHDLGFEIIGGVLPKRLTQDDFALLRSRLEQHGQRTGTITRLVVEPTKAKRVLERYRQFAPYLLLFSHRIDRCNLIQDDSTTLVGWQSRATGLEGVSVHRNSQEGAIKIAQGEVSLVVRLTPDGLSPFAPEIPNIWVTAPTREASKLGFLLNGKFDLDVGRAQLARDSQANLRTAQDAGERLASSFQALAGLSQQELATEIGLGAASLADFWSSAFATFSHGFNLQNQYETAVQIAWEVLWGPAGAYRALLEKRAVLPTGLPAPYERLTLVPNVKRYVAGLLAKPEVVTAACTWSAFRTAFQSGEVIHEDIALALRRVRVPIEASSVTLADLLDLQLGEYAQVTVEAAEELGQLITPEWFTHLPAEDQHELSAILRKARFLARDHQYHRAADLLIFDPQNEDGEESRRAAFTPPKNILEDNYTPAGQAFFKVCRGQMRAGVPTLQQWVLEASTEILKQNALRYLLYGELSHLGLRPELRKVASRCWLVEFESVPGFAAHEYADLKSYLGFYPELLSLEPPTPLEERAELLSHDPGELLTWVYSRWQEEQQERLEKHEKMTFPFTLELSRDYEASSPTHRLHWLVLLLTGNMLSLGRVQSEQNRGFLQRCLDKRWLERVLDREQGNERWLSVIEEYFDDAVKDDTEEYRYWMNQLLGIYQLSNWLDDYVHLILQLEHVTERRVIERIWSPMTLPDLSGSGIEAPPLGKALNLGKHFVLRELRRRNVLTNRHLDAYCFTPSKRIRDAFEQLGCTLEGNHMQASKAMHSFLVRHLDDEKATFQQGFDLPFWFRLHERNM